MCNSQGLALADNWGTHWTLAYLPWIPAEDSSSWFRPCWVWPLPKGELSFRKGLKNIRPGIHFQSRGGSPLSAELLMALQSIYNFESLFWKYAYSRSPTCPLQRPTGPSCCQPVGSHTVSLSVTAWIRQLPHRTKASLPLQYGLIFVYYTYKCM